MENEKLQVDQMVGEKAGLQLTTPTQPQSTGTRDFLWQIPILILYKSVAIRRSSTEVNGIIHVNIDEIIFMLLCNES